LTSHWSSIWPIFPTCNHLAQSVVLAQPV
jgi:hypothetical protein